MTTKFFGKESRKFDQANRMNIPPDFKKDLGDVVFIVKSIHNDHCLVLLSEEGWNNFANQVMEKKQGYSKAFLQRYLSSIADRVVLDKAGRITVKEEFKAYANLEEDVFIVGAMDRVELWNYATWLEETSIEKVGSIDLSDLAYS